MPHARSALAGHGGEGTGVAVRSRAGHLPWLRVRPRRGLPRPPQRDRHLISNAALLISKQYVLAMSFAMLEHLTEALIFPELKEYWFVSHVGFLMVIIGEVVRKLAVVTAGRSFTHVIRTNYEDQHQLITHGVYRFMRHPGYSGFLIWAVGTQVMLCNPVSTIAFTLVLWRFFSKRIPYEEFFLRQFFGCEYEEYAQKVHSGLPFIE